MKSKKTIIFVLTLLMTNALIAAGAADAHGDDHIPFDKIAFQAINLGILLVAIFFFIRKSIKQAFEDRQSAFKEQSAKTEQALEQAEAELTEIKEKIKKIESEEKNSYMTAEAEAEKTKNNIIIEAEAQTKKMLADVEMTIAAETQKAKSEIREEIIAATISIATNSIQDKQASITKKSESGFLTDLDQVRT